jgi:hypothetical protein
MATQSSTFRNRTQSRTTRTRTTRTARGRKRPVTRAAPSKSPGSTSGRRSTRRVRSRSAGAASFRGQGQSRQAQAREGGIFERAATAQEEAAVQRFLDGFTQALTSGDGRSAARCFEYPALMVMSAVGPYGGSQPLQDEESVAAFFDQAPQQYQAKGIHETIADLDDVQWVAEDLALARVRFPYLDEDGNDMGDGETSLYLVRRTQDDYAICAAITLGTDSDRAPA